MQLHGKRAIYDKNRRSEGILANPKKSRVSEIVIPQKAKTSHPYELGFRKAKERCVPTPPLPRSQILQSGVFCQHYSIRTVETHDDGICFATKTAESQKVS